MPLLFSIFFNHTEDEDDVEAAAPKRDADEEMCVVENVDTGVAATARTSNGEIDGSCITKFSGDSGKSVTVKKVEASKHGSCDLCGDDEENEHHHAAPQASEQESEPLVKKVFVNKQLCASILLGDAFHNFADGVFIAAAFKSCSTGTAVSIILVTLFHEIAQELADFILLTRYAGLSVARACLFNFLSGLSVCLGGIVFLAGDPSDEATGVILAMAGGVYFNIAACETIPRLEKIVKGRADRVWTLFSVIVGTVPIGLILLNHQHCG